MYPYPYVKSKGWTHMLTISCCGWAIWSGSLSLISQAPWGCQISRGLWETRERERVEHNFVSQHRESINQGRQLLKALAECSPCVQTTLIAPPTIITMEAREDREGAPCHSPPRCCSVVLSLNAHLLGGAVAHPQGHKRRSQTSTRRNSRHIPQRWWACLSGIIVQSNSRRHISVLFNVIYLESWLRVSATDIKALRKLQIYARTIINGSHFLCKTLGLCENPKLNSEMVLLN